MRVPYRRICKVGLLVAAIGAVAIASRTALERERYSQARRDISDFQADLRIFHNEYGYYPTADQGSQILFNLPDIDPGFVHGMAERSARLDPWGNPYFYQSDDQNYVLGSYGPHRSDYLDPDLLIRSY